MKDAYRLLAVDVDGTLLNSRNEVSPENRRALHRAHEAGLRVCLCTGRSLSETRDVIDQLGLDSDAGVFVFGAVVSELPAGRTVHRAEIPAPLASRLVGHFTERGYPVLVLYDGTADGCGWDYRLIAGERNVEAYEQWLRFAPARCERLDAWQNGPYAPVRIGIIDNPEHIEETVTLLGRQFPPSELKFNPIYAPNYGLHVVECFAPQVNKWYGIGRVAARMGIAEHQIVAVGDDVNDLEMITHAGLGVAMGNAILRIKAAAGWHAPSNDENGVAAVVEAVLRGELGPGRTAPSCQVRTD
jgi:5-amino-6-(5-phospho-D-ribitylamino)uracil phosphatase